MVSTWCVGWSASMKRVGLLCRRQGGSALGQLASLGAFLSAPEHASGCPEPRPTSAAASANQLFGPRWLAGHTGLALHLRGAPPYGSKPYPVRVTGVPPIRGPKAGEIVEKRMRLTL